MSEPKDDPNKEDRTEVGTFKKGRSGNPNGRPRKTRSVDDAVINTMHEKMPMRGGGRKTRLDITTARMANKGAEGNFQAAKFSLDLLQKAEHRKAEAETRTPLKLTESDEAIVARLIERLRRIDQNQEEDPS